MLDFVEGVFDDEGEVLALEAPANDSFQIMVKGRSFVIVGKFMAYHWLRAEVFVIQQCCGLAVDFVIGSDNTSFVCPECREKLAVEKKFTLVEEANGIREWLPRGELAGEMGLFLRLDSLESIMAAAEVLDIIRDKITLAPPLTWEITRSKK